MRFDKTLDVERAMAIYAHPDDAEFGMAGTVAKWAKAGVEFTYCMVTNGASGSQDPDMTRERLRDIRAAEQSEAAKILGVKNVVFLEFEDGYLEPTIDVRRAVARQIRIHKPDVIFTMDPTMRYGGGYVNHPDHIAAGEVVLRSINPDASTRQMLPELWQKERLEPHKPKALFLMAFGAPDTIVDVSDVVDVKIKALLAHRSQIDADSVDFIKSWMKEAGKKKRYAYAEGFKVMRFEEDGAPRRDARREGRKAPQARGRRVSRSTTTSRPARRSRYGRSSGSRPRRVRAARPTRRTRRAPCGRRRSADEREARTSCGTPDAPRRRLVRLRGREHRASRTAGSCP